MKCSVCVYFIALFFILVSVAAIPKERCERCMPMGDCAIFKDKTSQEQKKILEDFPCEKPHGGVFGFSSVAKGDNICCPDLNVWSIEGPSKLNGNNPQDGNLNIDSNDYNGSEDDLYEKSRLNNYQRRPQFNPNFNGNYYESPNDNVPVFNNPNYNNYPNFNGPSNNFNNYPTFNGITGNVPNANVQNQGIDNGNNFENGNSFGRTNTGQCMNQNNFPPAPETGCCGRDASSDRIIGQPGNRFSNSPVQNSNYWNPAAAYPQQYHPWSSNTSPRFTRSAKDDTVVIENRITGGRETELEQYPWTVLLLTTFDYGVRKASFNCGGSIISSRYVLTAGHCVKEDKARISDVDIYLAEYDKRTFPIDCVRVAGEGKRCIENMIMKPEDIILHPAYDDVKLQNDIALIRLRGNAPYTDFIRPICLPPIDIDNPNYHDLRLAVAGWGRDGKYASQVKQSTVVNLVPQRECMKSYPHLTRRHLCAAGHSGEDTCKGDSGGPLMMLYEGKYFVSGIVSGKRADSPCGTTVPSLYTNVYHYLDWIANTIRN